MSNKRQTRANRKNAEQSTGHAPRMVGRASRKMSRSMALKENGGQPACAVSLSAPVGVRYTLDRQQIMGNATQERFQLRGLNTTRDNLRPVESHGAEMGDSRLMYRVSETFTWILAVRSH
jgi:hypothetical protein